VFLQDKVKDINQRLEGLGDAFNVLVWGAEQHTGKLFERTELLSYRIKEIVDMDSGKQGSRYYGFTIQSPDQVHWKDIDAAVISVPGKEKQIIETLKEKYGFTGKVIELYDENETTPFYLLYDKNTVQVRYLGDYANWELALAECQGYEDEAIINKVIDSVHKVLDGEAVWERDGCLFYEPKFVYQITAPVLRCALQNQNQGVRILDIGGSLGSTWYQNRSYWKDIKNLNYVVAEQQHFADYGNRELRNENLSFINSMDEFGEKGYFDIILMSASLQYISEYEKIISKIRKAEPRYIILDRLLISDRMRICMETVPEAIYKSSYPVTIFTEERIRSYFEPKYHLIEKDISSVREEAWFKDGRMVSRYFVFEKDENNGG